MPHTELAEIVLDEFGYTEMWQNDRSADAAGRLENLKELVRSMEEFENLQGFLEHISLVMDRDRRRGRAGRQHHDAAFRQGAGVRHRVPARLGGRPVSASALARRERPRRPRGGAPPRPCRPDARAQSAPRSISPPTGASTACGRRRCRRAFSTSCRRRDVEVKEPAGGTGGFGMSGYGASRFDEMKSFGSNYTTPGWQRAQGAQGAQADSRERPAALCAGRRVRG